MRSGGLTGIEIFVLILLLLILALVVPAVHLAGWRLFTADGRSNWTVYDVEYPTVPTVIGLVAGAAWLVRREGTQAVAFAAPLLAIGSSFAAFMCFLFTTN